ncbi:MAG: hypothetical protein GYA43_09280 [Bacteroidales bacterium]|nr:hypothetical protein [Bacteroidales bacterium]
MRKILLFCLSIILLVFLCTAPADAQQRPRTKGKNPEKSLFGNKRKVKVVESRGVRKKKKEQQKKEEKLKKEYNDFVKQSRKRAFSIQTPDVQARMKQNEKDIVVREKQKKKQTSASAKKAARKYN